jgi:group I intron endonuclease
MNATENTECGVIGSTLTKNEPQQKVDIMIKKIAGIYGLRNILTNKWYVGQSIDVKFRWKKYSYSDCRNQTKLFNALKKYGYDSFEKIILEECLPDANVLNLREDYWIDYYDAIDNGYNIRRAGGKGPMPQETKDRISNALKGKPCPEYRKKMISDTLLGKCTGEKHPMFGKKHSEETKKKIREARAKQVITKEHRENMSKALMGKIVTEETRERISQSHKGKIMSGEARKKMSLARLGKPMSEETKKKISETMRLIKMSHIKTHK